MRIIYLLSISAILSACATSYQKEGATRGYTETQLDTNVFQVSFRGNGYTEKQRASDFTLLTVHMIRNSVRYVPWKD